MEYSNDPATDIFIKEYIKCKHYITDEMINLRYVDYMAYIKPQYLIKLSFTTILSKSYVHLDKDQNIRYNVFFENKIYSCITLDNKLVAVEVYSKHLLVFIKCNNCTAKEQNIVNIAASFWKCF